MFSKTTVWIPWIIILCLMTMFLAGMAVYQSDLPGGYHISESENFWSAELHQSIDCTQKKVAGSHVDVCNKQVISSTLVDYTVQGKYLLALRANRDAHFSKELCEHCLQQEMPCVDYWAINTDLHTLTGPLDKQGFEAFLSSRGIKPIQLKHQVPASAKAFCSE